MALVLLNGYDLRPGGPILTGSYRRRATGSAVLISSGKPASVGDDDKLAHSLKSQKLEAIFGRG